jgi:hypothetical protein
MWPGRDANMGTLRSRGRARQQCRRRDLQADCGDTFDDWSFVLGTNLNGPFLCAGVRTADTALRWWRDCEYRLDLRIAREHAARRLRYGKAAVINSPSSRPSARHNAFA